MVSSTPRPHFTPGKDPVPILQEAGCVPGPVWTGGKSRSHRDSIPGRPARSSVAIPTELPDPHLSGLVPGFPVRRPGFTPRAVHAGITVDKETLKQVGYSGYFCLLVSVFIILIQQMYSPIIWTVAPLEAEFTSNNLTQSHNKKETSATLNICCKKCWFTICLTTVH